MLSLLVQDPEIQSVCLCCLISAPMLLPVIEGVDGKSAQTRVDPDAGEGRPSMTRAVQKHTLCQLQCLLCAGNEGMYVLVLHHRLPTPALEEAPTWTRSQVEEHQKEGADAIAGKGDL
jgi:hypothetical protein